MPNKLPVGTPPPKREPTGLVYAAPTPNKDVGGATLAGTSFPANRPPVAGANNLLSPSA